MTKEKKKLLIEKIAIALTLFIVLALLVFFIKDVFFPFIKLQAEDNSEAAKELLISKGVLGAITVALVEALQMVVIFIPAEFIQLTSGMSYPWWLALLLCDAGVVLGASIIYFIVHIFKFDGGMKKRSGRIDRYEKAVKTESTPLFMYILFIMPIIPFGLICYWAAGKKISYPRYVFTCATGVIPSIFTSIVMGAAAKEFISRSIPLWLLVLIIVLAAAFLFVLLALVLNKFFFKKSKGTPDSPLYSFVVNVSGKISRLLRHKKLNVKPNGAEKIEGPHILISNHRSAFDFYYLSKINPENRYAMVTNRYYMDHTPLGKLLYSAGAIPKKMFTPDFDTIRRIIKAIKSGYPVAMCPEGRLSPDGSPSPISDSTAGLIKSLGVPLVIANIKKAFFAKPKWRKRRMRTDIDVEVKKIVYPEEIANLTKAELHKIIVENLDFSDFDEKVNLKRKGKAEGLSNLLYFCPTCRTYYSLESKGDEIVCKNCGEKHVIASDYSFKGGKYKNLHEYYDEIIALEKENLEEVKLVIPVSVKIFPYKKKKNGKDEGVFTIDKNGVLYESGTSDLKIFYRPEDLEGLAYSSGEEFEFYYDNELYYFYPKENPQICARVSVLFDLLHERALNLGKKDD